MIYGCLNKSVRSDDISALYPYTTSHMYMRLFANTGIYRKLWLYQKFFITKILYKNIIYIAWMAYNWSYTHGKLFGTVGALKKGRFSWTWSAHYFTWKYHIDQWVVSLGSYSSGEFNWPTRFFSRNWAGTSPLSQAVI